MFTVNQPPLEFVLILKLFYHLPSKLVWFTNYFEDVFGFSKTGLNVGQILTKLSRRISWVNECFHK